MDYLEHIEERTDDSLIGAERSVVGAMMLDGRRVADVKSAVRAIDFYDARYQAIAETCFELDQKGRPVDVISVGTRMRVTGRFTPEFSETLLHELTAEVPTASNAGYYAGIVKGGAERRRLRAAGLKMIAAADNPAIEILHAIEEGRELLDDALPGDLDQRMIGSYTDELLEDMTATADPAIRTPWPDLDALIHGWKPGRLVVVGARPAQGKTVVGCQIALVAAQWHSVAYFTGEMDKKEILNRLYASVGGIPIGAFERRDLGPFMDRFNEARRIVENLKLAVNDTAATWDDIETATWDLHRKGGLKMIVVDYVGLYPDGSRKFESEQAELASVSRRAKKLAKRLDITVVLLAQLNRGGATVGPAGDMKPPTLETLRGSGAFEQDADLVVLLHQGMKKDAVTKQITRDGSLWLNIEKQRNGPVGSVELLFQGAYARADHIMHAR